MSAARCPICGKPTDAEQRPFCSPRCKAVDLGRWFSEDYKLPMSDEASDEAPDERE